MVFCYCLSASFTCSFEKNNKEIGAMEQETILQ